MISQAGIQNVEKSEGLTESTFRIKTNAKAFQILSSGLYSDKIRAILRELSANAYDSHIEAGNTNPFEVNLPNDMEPYFYIRDYGTGISHHNILHIYTTYFDSTRSNSNEMVGMMGLGSKSPLAYTDSFSVTSWHGGMKRIYNVYVNENGIPAITTMVETPSEEPNGLEVKFPVKTGDITNFRNRAATVFSNFRIVPKITGQTVSIVKQEYFLQRPNWGLRKNNKVDYHNGARAIMGNIAYPLDYPDSNLTEIQKAIMNTDIDINFPIGELDVSASRESLSYDKSTKENICKRLDQIATEIQQEIVSELEKCKCLWDARLMVYQLAAGAYSKLNNFLRNSKVSLTWNGVDLFKDNSLGTINISGIAEKIEGTMWAPPRSYGRRRKAVSNLIHYMPIQDNLEIFVHDGCKHTELRIKKHFETPSSNGDSNKPLLVVLRSHTPDGLSELKKIVGMLETTEFKKLSDLPFDPIIRTQNYEYNPKNAAKILLWNEKYSDSEPSRGWDKTTIDLAAGGVYVPIERYEISLNNHRKSTLRYVGVCKQLCGIMGIGFPIIYGVKSRELENMEKRTNWQTLQAYMETTCKTYLADLTTISTIKYQKFFGQSADHIFTYDSEVHGKRNMFKHILRQRIDLSFVKELEPLTTILQNINDLGENFEHLDEYLIFLFGHDYQTLLNVEMVLSEDETNTIKNLAHEAVRYVMENYPMIGIIMGSAGAIHENKKHIVAEYIDMIERNKASLTVG